MTAAGSGDGSGNEWSIGEALFLICLTVLIELLAGFAGQVKGVDIDPVFILILARLADLACIFLYLFWKRRKPLSALGIEFASVKGGVRVGTVVCLFFLFAVILLEFIGQLFFSVDLLRLIFSSNRASGGAGFNHQYSFSYLFAGVLVAPVVEELLFRSILFSALREKMSLAAAIACNSLLFALAHGFSYQAAVIPMIGGVAFCLLYEKTGNAIASICLHAAGNFTIIMLIFFYAGYG